VFAAVNRIAYSAIFFPFCLPYLPAIQPQDLRQPRVCCTLSRTNLIFSSEEYYLRVARLISLTVFSQGLSVVFLISYSSVVPMSQEHSLINSTYLDPQALTSDKWMLIWGHDGATRALLSAGLSIAFVPTAKADDSPATKHVGHLRSFVRKAGPPKLPFKGLAARGSSGLISLRKPVFERW